MSTARNIAVLMTPRGVAAIAVVRLRGPGVGRFLERHFSKPAKLNRCVHANLMEGERVIDDAVVVLFDPETADVNVHGGTWVVQSVLELAVREAFELVAANDLPLPQEASDGGNVLEREIECYLPMAKTELGVRTLLAQRGAWLDLRKRVGEDSFGSELASVLGDQSLIHLLNPPTVAIVGPANVGKSTLANRLFSQERSVTADVPGTTRDWVGEIANIDGLAVLLLDTPGLRETEDRIEATAIDRSRRQIQGASLVVLVLDATRPLAGEQAELCGAFADSLVAINKSDRAFHPELERVEAIRTIATTGEGVDELRTAIVRHFCMAYPVDPQRPRVWTVRQREIVRRAVAEPGCVEQLFH
jgi:tRNA modification GTPase